MNSATRGYKTIIKKPTVCQQYLLTIVNNVKTIHFHDLVSEYCLWFIKADVLI